MQPTYEYEEYSNALRVRIHRYKWDQGKCDCVEFARSVFRGNPWYTATVYDNTSEVYNGALTEAEYNAHGPHTATQWRLKALEKAADIADAYRAYVARKRSEELKQLDQECAALQASIAALQTEVKAGETTDDND